MQRTIMKITGLPWAPLDLAAMKIPAPISHRRKKNLYNCLCLIFKHALFEVSDEYIWLGIKVRTEIGNEDSKFHAM